MNLRPLLGAVLLFVLPLVSSSSALSQTRTEIPEDFPSPETSSETNNIHLSDRENAELRGPVSTLIEKTVTTKYSPDGKLLTSASAPVGHIEIHYEHGVKTTIQTFDYSMPRAAFIYGEGFSPWDSAASGEGVPKGGNVTTLYDENNQARELQIRRADGSVIFKFVRTYNTNGRVTEEKIIWENPTAYILDNIPETDWETISPEDLQGLVATGTSMLRGKSQIGAFYTFDEQNRLAKTVERNETLEKKTTITYNEQGDEAEKRATFADNGDFQSEVLPYTVRYTYQYDSFGNWVQRIRTVSTDSQAEESSVRNRKLTYY
jgi:hypothetical protein